MKKYLIFSLLFLTVIISGCSNKQTNENKVADNSSVNSTTTQQKTADIVTSTIKDKVSSCTSSTGKVMTYGKALEIAKASSCAKVGNFTGEYGCNDNSGGFVDVYAKPIDNPGCGFTCRVSIDKEVAEEGWMCTGLIPATEEEFNKIPTISSLDPSQVLPLNTGESQQEICEQEGGKWTSGEPQYGGQRCIKSYADAGKKCTNSDQCLGDCVTNIVSNLGKEGTCQKTNDRELCFNPVENERFQCLLGDIMAFCDGKRWDYQCDNLLKDKDFFK